VRADTDSYWARGVKEVAPVGEARILVVDDEPSITDAVSTALRYEGFEVTEAGGGREALRLAGSFKPDRPLRR